MAEDPKTENGSAKEIRSIIATDSALLRGIRLGDEDAAQCLFDRYVGQLQALANRQLAKELSGRVDTEDVTQSIFRTLFRRLQAGQYSVPTGDTIWRLLVTIALNKIRKVGEYHRAAKRDIRRVSQVEDTAIENVGWGDDEVALRLLKLTINEVLEDLTGIQQRIVELRLEGEEVNAIAAKTGRSKRTVERTLQGFRHSLRQVLCESEQHDESRDS